MKKATWNDIQMKNNVKYVFINMRIVLSITEKMSIFFSASSQSGALYTPPFEYGMCVTVVVNVVIVLNHFVLYPYYIRVSQRMYSIECYISIL